VRFLGNAVLGDSFRRKARELAIEGSPPPFGEQRCELGIDLVVCKARSHGPEQAFPCLSRCNVAGGTGQQPYAQPGFKAADGLAQR